MTQSHEPNTSTSVQSRIGYPNIRLENTRSTERSARELPYYPPGKRTYVKPFSARPKPILLDWSLGDEPGAIRNQDTASLHEKNPVLDWMTDE